jgi:D-sedoheptulose 7-phosphate isomerase
MSQQRQGVMGQSASQLSHPAPQRISLGEHLQQHLELFRGLSALSSVVDEAARVVASALREGHKLLLCGNGGSAADAQHMAAEFTGRFVNDRRPLAALALSTDTSALTCIANDYGFEEVFRRQLLALAQAGDVLLAISTSGKSTNVIRAAEAARAARVRTIGLLGCGGGPLAALCDTAIIVPSEVTARVQEAHIFIGHTLCSLVEQALSLA